MAFFHGPLEASVLGRSMLQGGCSLKGRRQMEELLVSVGTLRWARPGSPGESSTEELDGRVPGQGDAGRIRRKYHSSPTTTVLASAGPGETPSRDHRGSDT